MHENKQLMNMPQLAILLGTYTQHLANYNRIISELEFIRNQKPLLQERYESNIELTRQLVKKQLLVIQIPETKHDIICSEGLKAHSLLDKPHGRHTLDIMLGLDNFVFVSYHHTQRGTYGDKILNLELDVLDLPGTLFTMEDIVIEMQANPIYHKELKFKTGEWHERFSESIKTTIENWLLQIMPGNKFLEFTTQFIATYYVKPETYFSSRGRPDIAIRIPNDADWGSPEIKIYGSIDKKFIKKS
jgi:hypothetical protein